MSTRNESGGRRSGRRRARRIVAVVVCLAAVPVVVATASEGEMTVRNVEVPCWLQKPGNPGPSGDPEIIVGNLYGRITSSGAVAVADAYFDDESGDCGWGDLVYKGGYPAATAFTIRVETAIATDEHSTIDGDVELWLMVRHWSKANCTGDPLSSLITRPVTVSFPAATGVKRDWLEVDVWDATFSVPATSPTGPDNVDSWWYRVYTKVTPTSGSIAWDYDDGCFNIKGAAP